MDKKSLNLIVCFLASLSSFGQVANKIAGKVLAAEAKPIIGATVTLLRDSTAVLTAITDSAGSFTFTNLAPATYFLSVTAIGYVGHTEDTILVDGINASKQLRLLMKENSVVLKGVSVTAKRPFIEQKIDRTIVNVDALISNAGVTALDVLENAPGVVVSNEGLISLKGKSGVVVFIDDKPTYLSPQDLTNYLKSLPAGTLDKIEIMPNPPARYDAAGNAGVINIRTKKNHAGGFNGGVSLAFGQGKYSRTNNSFNFNYKNQKLNAFGTASYSLNNSFNDLDIFRYYYNSSGSLRSTFFQNSFIRNTNYSTNLKLGVDYFLTPKSTVGILVNGILRPSVSTTRNISNVANAVGVTDSVITANNTEEVIWKKGSVNLNYLYKHSAEKELSFDVDYITYDEDQEQTFANGVFGPLGNQKSTDGLTGNLPSRINIYSFKTDYSHAINQTTKLSAGAKVSYVSTNNAANYFTVNNAAIEPDYEKTNHFLYKETINAGYLNLNKDWDRLSIQLGTRLESTISDGHQLGNRTKPDSSFRRSYTSLFPTAYLLYKLDTLSHHQLSFSYGRRIDRPFYQDLNPFISPLDKFSIYVGNPYLKPTFTNTFELSHIYKNKVTTTLSYSSTTDIIEETIDLANSIYISRPANIGKSTVLGLSATASIKPATWWSTSLYAEVQKRSYRGVVYNYELDTSSIYFGTNTTNQFTLGKGWTAELSGNYRTGILVGQIISGETGRLNVGVSKKILHNLGSVKLNFRDIFRTGLNHGIITSIKNAYATYHNWGDTRNFFLTFTYNFGKSSNSPRNRNSGAETEQSRVKN